MSKPKPLQLALLEYIVESLSLNSKQGMKATAWLLHNVFLIRSKRTLAREAALKRIFQNIHPDAAGEYWAWLERAISYCTLDSIQKYAKASKLRVLVRKPLLSANTINLGFENLPLMPDRQARPRSSAPGSRAATTDSGGGGPDEPDPDPDPERPYIALGIDHKATTPAGPPVPVSLRLFSLYRIEMRYCHEGDQPDHPEP